MECSRVDIDSYSQEECFKSFLAAKSSVWASIGDDADRRELHQSAVAVSSRSPNHDLLGQPARDSNPSPHSHNDQRIARLSNQNSPSITDTQSLKPNAIGWTGRDVVNQNFSVGIDAGEWICGHDWSQCAAIAIGGYARNGQQAGMFTASNSNLFPFAMLVPRRTETGSTTNRKWKPRRLPSDAGTPAKQGLTASGGVHSAFQCWTRKGVDAGINNDCGFKPRTAKENQRTTIWLA